jgi:hypothetical protein
MDRSAKPVAPNARRNHSALLYLCSKANAFDFVQAVPVFVDIREDTLNLDERLIEAVITPEMRAGICCAMVSIVLSPSAISPDCRGCSGDIMLCSP